MTTAWAENPVALVTGASSGIGTELAKVFAANGHHLILTGRNELALNTLAESCQARYPIRAATFVQDLAEPNAAVRVVEFAHQLPVHVDVLVNNAGFGVYGDFADADPQANLELLQVNIVALTQLTGLLLKPMLDRGHGKILNVASAAAFQAGPMMATYYASKAYVLSFSEAIAAETASKGIIVSALCPGPVGTGFGKRAGTPQSRPFHNHGLDAATVAQAGYDALLKGKRFVVPGFTSRLMSIAAQLAPRRMATAVAHRLNRPA